MSYSTAGKAALRLLATLVRPSSLLGALAFIALAAPATAQTLAAEPVFAEPVSAEPIAGVAEMEEAQEQGLSFSPATLPIPEADADALSQVSSVNDFSDVLPSDWAFQALANLVERYNCIVGYPDGTFRGSRSLTRFEFAAGLSSCLDVITSLVAVDQPSRADLETLQRLQQEFADELAVLEQRVATLEADTAELEANQFATQTKLRGVVFAHIGGGFANGAIRAEGFNVFAGGRDAAGNPIQRLIDADPSVNYGALTWIDLDTSFTGSDRLTIQLVGGNGVGPGNFYASAGLFNTFGTPFTFQNGGTSSFDLTIRELTYSFPVGDRISLEVGPRINWYRYFDNNRYTFLITGANSFNSSGGTQVNAVDRGAGAIAVWDITDWLDLRLGYLAESTEFLPGLRPAGDPTQGLFGGPSTLTAQVGFSPSSSFNLRLLYNRTNLTPNGAGLIGGAVSEPLYGLADDGAGGPLANASADTFLVNFDWTPFEWLGLFGRYSYGSTFLRQGGTGVGLGSVDAQSFQVGLAFPDLLKEGALATVSYLVPFDITSGGDFLVSGAGDGGTQQELEVSYRYPINRRMAVVPSFYWIMNANNFSSNPDIFLFNLQTQLFF